MGRRTFSPEFKLEAVKLVRERGVTISQAARDLGMHVNVLRKWVRGSCRGRGAGVSGSWASSPDDAEIARLRRELAKPKRSGTS